MAQYVVVASTNGRVGLQQAAELLAAGGSSLDAVETGCRLVESNREDHTVGLGGLPNLVGEVELDAGIMDGSNRMAGAVGAVKGFEHPISIARLVMERTPHTFLAGSGAERFAAEMGFERTELLTPEAKQQWEARLRQEVPDTEPGLMRYHENAAKYLELSRDPEHAKQETVNFIALDSQGNLSSGASTSGWYMKYPGRLGDSPVVGAGFYADSRYGAATCTGRGEMAIRTVTAASVVMHMRNGASVEDAVRAALEDADSLYDPYKSGLNVLAMDPQGRHAAASNRSGASYVWRDSTAGEIQESPRFVIGENPEAGEAPH